MDFFWCNVSISGKLSLKPVNSWLSLGFFLFSWARHLLVLLDLNELLECLMAELNFFDRAMVLDELKGTFKLGFRVSTISIGINKVEDLFSLCDLLFGEFKAFVFGPFGVHFFSDFQILWHSFKTCFDLGCIISRDF